MAKVLVTSIFIFFPQCFQSFEIQEILFYPCLFCSRRLLLIWIGPKYGKSYRVIIITLIIANVDYGQFCENMYKSCYQEFLFPAQCMDPLAPHLDCYLCTLAINSIPHNPDF